MDHDIFISHASKDKSTADAVCASLEQEGIRCWIASRDILPGSEWAEAILNAIAVARVMVIVFSSDSNVSMQVKQEVTQAIDKGLILVVFRIEDVLPSGTLELYLRPWHWLDAFTHPVEGHIHHVVQVVQGILQDQLPPSDQTGEPGPPVRLAILPGNDGYSITFNTRDPAAEILYRFPSDESYTSTGPSPCDIDPTTGKRMAAQSITVPHLDRGKHTLDVKYVDVYGRERGPYSLPFDTTDIDVTFLKYVMRQPGIVGFDAPTGELSLYFSGLLSFKYAISEIRYSLDDESLSERVRFSPASDPRYSGIAEDDDAYVNVLPDTRFAAVRVTFIDGTQSKVIRIENDCKMPQALDDE